MFIGVSQLAVAINKLDTIDWSQDRYNQICDTLRAFLQKQGGFPHITFVSVSGLNGDNLTKSPADDHPLSQWYHNGSMSLVCVWLIVRG